MKKIITVLLLGLSLVACMPSTPQARIQENPRKYAALGTTQQLLVQQGQLARGMSTDAVYLAWGPPARIFQGSKDGKLTERWDYGGAQAVPVTNFYGAYGYGGGRYGPHGRHGYSGIGFGFGPEIAYVPYRVASVRFINGRVDSWERVR